MELSSRADEETNRSGSDSKSFELNAGQSPSRRHSMTENQRQNSIGSGGQQQNSSPSPDPFLQEKPSHQHYLSEFRVEACPLFKQHQCQQHRPFTCFKWHFANQRRRRPVKRNDGSFNYSPDIYCDKYDENTGICPDGDDCIFLHRVSGDVERKYHLRYYKTAQCVHPTDARGQCVKNGAHCAFAHTANDIRPPMFDQHEVGFSTVVDGEGRDKTSFVIEDPQWHYLSQKSMSAADEDALPVFLNTTELRFRLNETSQAKLFTLYNPFGHSITYKILCTATRNYTVNETTGILQAKCCQDIVVRCIQRLPVGTVDKLKIEISKKGQPTSSGSCVINLHTVGVDYMDPADQQRFEKLPQTNKMTTSLTNSERGGDRNQSNMWMCLIVGLCCAIALVCPTAGEPDSSKSSVPPMLHMSLQQKLVASYILGIVSVIILRPM